MKFKKNFITIAVICLLMSLAGTVMAGHGEEAEVKKGILLVAFGSSIPDAQVSFEELDKAVKAAFPDVSVQWAFTSKIIRDKLAEEEGRTLLSPAEALASMKEDGFTHVAVQSLHSIPGGEYSDLIRIVDGFKGMPGFEKLTVGDPLMSTDADVQRVAEILLSVVPSERKADEAVVFMGHGTHHPGNIYYPGIQYYMWQTDPNVFVGTVEGSPSLDNVLAGIQARDIKTAYLMPFMSVAGDHAVNDMAGDEDDSWKTVLTKAGIKCVPVLKGTAEYEAVRQVWIDHLAVAVEAL